MEVRGIKRKKDPTEDGHEGDKRSKPSSSSEFPPHPPPYSLWGAVEKCSLMVHSGSSSRSGQVDPDRLNIEDEFSFVYARGARAGERRSARLQRKEKRDMSILLVCEETNQKGEVIERSYWPSHTSGTRYSRVNESPRAEELEDCGAGSHWPDEWVISHMGKVVCGPLQSLVGGHDG